MPGTFRQLVRGLRTEWREIGGLGRVAILGLGAAFALTVVMGFAITTVARSNLLRARADLITADVRALPDLTSDDRPGSRAFAVFGTEVEHELLGGETERVKVWAPDGTILYSDNSNLVGDRFELTGPARAAFGGEMTTEISDLSDPAHAQDRSFGELIEVYVPRLGVDGSVETVVEVEQRLDSLSEAMSSIRRSVWLSIGFGVLMLAAFLAALGISTARNVNRRRQAAERLLGLVFTAQEVERRRIVGALHDDIGQPLYRLLYGLAGSRAKLGDGDPVGDELERLEELVREVDGTLRGELRQLHHGLAEDVGLPAALEDLASVTEAESTLRLSTDIEDVPPALSSVRRTALFRAAQEAVVNTRRHAKAEHAWLKLESEGEVVTLVVEDDGVGIDAEPGLGLATTRERLQALGGGLRVKRRRGGGTSFTAWVPTEEAGR
jgi:signal transduction histidine kinase